MDYTEERQLNQSAFRRLREWIKENYPAGRFVVISEGKVIADANQFSELGALVAAQGKDLRNTLVVQAGVEYPEFAFILAAESPQ